MPVTVGCIGDYLDAVQAQWLGDGVAIQCKAFSQGLGEVFALDALLAFTGAEMVAMVSTKRLHRNHSYASLRLP